MDKKLIQASDRIYYLPGEEDTDTPYLYYIRGDQYSVAVDAGNCQSHVTTFYQVLQDAGLPLPQYTLITHWHWDHTFGLTYIHGQSVGNELTRQKLAQVSKWIWTPEEMKHREESGEDIVMCNECIRKVYPDLSQIRVTTVDRGITEPEI